MPAKSVKLTKEEARQLTLRSQLLLGVKPKKGKQGALSTIQSLGYVQIDTINVVERAHHLTLRSRVHDYQKKFLHELQAKDRKIFEYWAHAASFIPTENYRFYRSYMARQKSPRKDSWLAGWSAKYGSLIGKVKKRIEREGPLSASDFKDVPGRKRGPWWDWKPAKAALEILFWQGELMVTERRNFQRVYDLTDRVLPKNINITKPTDAEEKRFFIERALHALGLATVQDINRYIGIAGKLNAAVQTMEKSRILTPVSVEGSKKRYFSLSSAPIRRKSSDSRVVHLLSPFDNAIILRERVRDLFEFDYCLECYVPKNKRKFGYFCLPILWQDGLVGRIDPKTDRTTNTLIINGLHLANKKLLRNEFLKPFSRALRDFACFNGCVSITFSDTIPPAFRNALKPFF